LSFPEQEIQIMRAIRNWMIGLMAVAAIGLTGCLEFTSIITVAKDGSGTITDVVFLSANAQAMMGGLAAMGAQGGAKPAAPKVQPGLAPSDIEKYKARAKRMGDGVSYKSAVAVRAKDGRTGARITYTFTDISKLSLSPDVQPPGQGGAGGGSMELKTDQPPITFAFNPGDTPQLVVNMPRKEKEKGDPDVPPAEVPAPDPMAIMMMQQMFAGMRIRVLLNVKGNITETNAKYVAKTRKTGKKSVVTLMDIDIGAVVKNPTALQKLMTVGEQLQGADTETALKNLSEFPQLKIEPARKVKITFK